MDAADPVTAIAAALLVWRFIPEMEAVPATVIVAVPAIVTLGVVASHVKAARLTPAFKVMFSVYVPSLMKIVSPDEADVSAAAIVVCVPCVASAETIHLATPKVFVLICCAITLPLTELIVLDQVVLQWCHPPHHLHSPVYELL